MNDKPPPIARSEHLPSFIYHSSDRRTALDSAERVLAGLANSSTPTASPPSTRDILRQSNGKWSVFPPLWQFRGLSSASSSLQASEGQLWIPRFIDLTAQRSMARFSADLAYASCDLRFARLQTAAEATTLGHGQLTTAAVTSAEVL